MLAFVCRLFLYKNIARRLLRNFADNLHKYKTNFLWRFPTNLSIFIVCEVNYSYQFCYLIKKCRDNIQREERADRKKTHEERTDNMCYMFL